MSKTSESFLKAIEIIADQKINTLSFNKTALCTIVQSLGYGKYVVSDGATIFTAYSTNEIEYNIDDRVNVNIPNNDYTQMKTITGKYIANSNNMDYVTKRPITNFLDVSGNLSNDSEIKSIVINSIYKPNEPNDVEIFHYIFDENSAAQYAKLKIGVEFKTVGLSASTSGTYGLKIFISGIDDNGQLITYPFTYTSDKDLLGNVYNYPIFQPHNIAFDIAQCGKIREIVINLWQDGNFTVNNGTIFCRNLTVSLGYDKQQFKTKTVQLYSQPNILEYNSSQKGASINQKKLAFHWFDIDNKGSLELVPLEKIQTNPQIAVHWYRKQIDNTDELAGQGWIEIKNIQEYEKYNINELPIDLSSSTNNSDIYKVIIESPSREYIQVNYIDVFFTDETVILTDTQNSANNKTYADYKTAKALYEEVQLYQPDINDLSASNKTTFIDFIQELSAEKQHRYIDLCNWLERHNNQFPPEEAISEQAEEEVSRYQNIPLKAIIDAFNEMKKIYIDNYTTLNRAYNNATLKYPQPNRIVSNELTFINQHKQGAGTTISSLTITSKDGDAFVSHNANGQLKSSEAKPHEIITTGSINIDAEDTNTDVKVKWIFPFNNNMTMIKAIGINENDQIDLDKINNTDAGDELFYKDGDNIIYTQTYIIDELINNTFEKSFYFTIKSDFNAINGKPENNLFIVKAEVGDNNNEAMTQLSFTKAINQSAGVGLSLRVVGDDDFAGFTGTDSKTITIEAILMSSNNRQLAIAPGAVDFRLLGNNIDNTFGDKIIDRDKNTYTITVTNLENLKNSYPIVKAVITIQDSEADGISKESYLPLAWRKTNEYNINCSSIIRYSSSGIEPQFFDDELQLFKKDENGSSKVVTSVKWSTLLSNENKEIFYPKIQDNKLQPLAIYVNDNTYFAIQCSSSDNDILFIQPIAIIQDKYDALVRTNFGDINDIYNTDATSLDYATASIGNNNTLSGFFVGSKLNIDGMAKSGIFGYQDGNLKLQLTSDGQISIKDIDVNQINTGNQYTAQWDTLSIQTKTYKIINGLICDPNNDEPVNDVNIMVIANEGEEYISLPVITQK